MTFKTYSSIRAHLSRKHPNSPDPAPDPTEEEETSMDTVSNHGVSASPDLCNADQTDAATVVPYTSSVNKHAALLLLTLKEKHRLTQTSINFAVQQVQSLVEHTLEDVKASVEEKLQQHSTEFGDYLPDISDCFMNIDPFSGLESEYRQTKFYKENFDLIVSLIPHYTMASLTSLVIAGTRNNCTRSETKTHRYWIQKEANGSKGNISICALITRITEPL